MVGIPMQVSLPLALHLRSPVTYDFFTGQHWKPGEKYQRGRNLEDFAFIDSRPERRKSTLLFASILRSIFNHPDWSQLHAFFSKRYGKRQMFKDREARKLTPPETMDAWEKGSTKAIMHFKTDPSSVGLPRDLTVKLADAGVMITGRLIGADPQPCAIGPAISVAIGPGAYMDLVYAEHPPGKYSESQLVTGALATTKKGGRGRSWAEWAELWAIIADWVYEHEAASLEMLYIDKYSYKYDPSDEVHKTLPHGKIPREFLATDAIDAADAIRDVFAQLAAKPTDFQGIEWDFLDLEVTRDVRDAFFARFGRNPDSQKFMEESIDRTKPYSLETLKKMVEPVAGSRWGDLNLYNVSPVALKRCPVGFLGADWEAWLMSIEGGDVVVVKTVFQALWAVMLLVQLPLNIKILSREERLPRYQDPNNIYIGASS